MNIYREVSHVGSKGYHNSGALSGSLNGGNTKAGPTKTIGLQANAIG
jgi:hypothetical protein